MTSWTYFVLVDLAAGPRMSACSVVEGGCCDAGTVPGAALQPVTRVASEKAASAWGNRIARSPSVATECVCIEVRCGARRDHARPRRFVPPRRSTWRGALVVAPEHR